MQIKKNVDIISLDLSHDELMLAYLKTSGKKTEFINLINKSIHGLEVDEIAQLVLKTISALKLKNPYIVNVVPLHLAITKNLEIPSQDENEIKEIIDLQSGRQTPYSREEIIVDYLNLGVVKQSYSKIFLVIVARAAIKRQFDIIDTTGLRISKVVFAPEAISQICAGCVKQEYQDYPAAMVHVGLAFTDFIIAIKGTPLFMRSIPIGTKHLSLNKEAAKSKFVEEIKSSLDTYQSEDIDRAPQTLILTGALEFISDLKNDLIAQIFIPIQVVSYAELMPLSSDVQKNMSAFKHLSFFNVTGAVLSMKSTVLNLIPDEIKLRIAFEQRVQEIIKLFIYIICILILCGSIFASKLYFKGMYLKKLKLKNETYSEEASILEKAMERIRVIKHYLKQRGYSLEVISALYDILPKDIMLDDIKMDQEKNLYLKGTGRAMSSVFSFVSALEDSEYFSKVDTNYTTSRKKDDQDWADFGITCVIVK